MEILLPLTARGATAGVLALVSRKALADPDPSDLQTLETLCTMLAMAAHDGAAIRPVQAARRIEQVLAPLTAREREVLALLPQGLTNADIGRKLGIATGTVKVHVERIIHKLALGDRTQAAALAVELGFVGSGIKP
ncbi:response regulator transcription factor [Massilia forsythiae]|uniref:Response regulator transcription factor n=2 Tax=Massilia forsythiae TaxID=2728020 RepID=A0A7Z2ZUY2_9BURK|nr:response regulator transcription factor [Massilia forsythiae]